MAFGLKDKSLYDAFYSNEIPEGMDLTDSFLNLDEHLENIDNAMEDFDKKLENWMRQFDEDAPPIRRPEKSVHYPSPTTKDEDMVKSLERTVHPHSKESITDRLRSEFKVDPRIEEMAKEKKKLQEKVDKLKQKNTNLEIKVLQLERERDDLVERLATHIKNVQIAEKKKKQKESIKSIFKPIIDWFTT